MIWFASVNTISSTTSGQFARPTSKWASVHSCRSQFAAVRVMPCPIYADSIAVNSVERRLLPHTFVRTNAPIGRMKVRDLHGVETTVFATSKA